MHDDTTVFFDDDTICFFSNKTPSFFDEFATDYLYWAHQHLKGRDQLTEALFLLFQLEHTRESLESTA